MQIEKSSFESFTDTSYWRIICIIALSGILLFTGITTSAYIDNGKLSQNLLTTEEGRYIFFAREVFVRFVTYNVGVCCKLPKPFLSVPAM